MSECWANDLLCGTRSGGLGEEGRGGRERREGEEGREGQRGGEGQRDGRLGRGELGQHEPVPLEELLLPCR